MRPGAPQTSITALSVVLQLLVRADSVVDRAALIAELEDGTGDMPVADALAALEADRFVDADGAGGIELSDKGWLWIGQEMAERPDDELLEDLEGDERLWANVLYAFLNMVARYLEIQDLSLAEFVSIARSRPPRA